MNILLLFLASFIVVMLLGLQSQFVRDKQKTLSFIMSIGIGSCQLLSYKLVPNASLIESVSFILGGACGITASIYLHDYYLHKFKK